jgi:hypothetical protein
MIIGKKKKKILTGQGRLKLVFFDRNWAISLKSRRKSCPIRLVGEPCW